MPTDLARTPVLHVLRADSNLTTQISQTRFGAERKMKPMISRVVGTLAAALIVVSPTNPRQNEDARPLGDVAREQQLERKQKAKTGGTVHIDIAADPNKSEPTPRRRTPSLHRVRAHQANALRRLQSPRNQSPRQIGPIILSSIGRRSTNQISLSFLQGPKLESTLSMAR